MCMNYNETSQWAADLGSGYSSIRPLGEGGMGTLYRAHKDSLDVDVVIKRVKQKFKGRMDERAEANILKTLKHKYLPRIYDVIESPSGYVYTIMDMIPGENMQNYVKTHGSVSQKLAYRWACQLCEVIAYLHSQVPPILHCDIKPSNIMITPNEDICVIDFNTSLVFSKGVLAIGATPGYAAPEQYTRPGASPDTIETVPLEETMPLRGYKDAFAYQNVRSNKGPSGRGVSNSVTAAQATNAGGYGTISKRTDVYGIGATLYYAITGQQPGHSLKDVRPITSYKLKFSRSFLLIIARAMKKRQEERFCDAQEMLRALQDIHAASLLQTFVGGTVVHHNEPEVLFGLGIDRLDRILQPALAVDIRDHDSRFIHKYSCISVQVHGNSIAYLHTKRNRIPAGCGFGRAKIMRQGLSRCWKEWCRDPRRTPEPPHRWELR